MSGKVSKIILDVVLSFVFLIVMSIVINWIAGLIFGTKSNGDADFNGGVLLAVTAAITLVFAVWFYKYVAIKKIEK
jgi:hypothetical protein